MLSLRRPHLVGALTMYTSLGSHPLHESASAERRIGSGSYLVRRMASALDDWVAAVGVADLESRVGEVASPEVRS